MYSRAGAIIEELQGPRVREIFAFHELIGSSVLKGSTRRNDFAGAVLPANSVMFTPSFLAPIQTLRPSRRAVCVGQCQLGKRPPASAVGMIPLGCYADLTVRPHHIRTGNRVPEIPAVIER
jgi:hypothetical protein